MFPNKFKPNKLFHLWIGLVILAGALLAAPNPAGAAKTLYVSKSSEDISGDCTAVDPCRTIQRALLAAADGDRIEIGSGIYMEHLLIDKSVTMLGSGPGATIISSDLPPERILTIQDAPGEATSVTLENLIIRDGKTSLNGAGISTSASQLKLVNVRVTKNESTTANGGGIACLAGALTIEKSSIDNNLAYQGGGGIWVGTGCALSMSESAVFLNVGGHAGGLWLEGSAQLINSTISSNSAQRPGVSERGGGIEVWEGGALSMNHVTLAFNWMESDNFEQGSQVWVKEGGQASLTNTLLHNFPDLKAPVCTGELTSGGYNLSEDASCDYSTAAKAAWLLRILPRLSSPRANMFKAAFSSRSIFNPQPGQSCTRTDKDLSTTIPQHEQRCDVPLGSTNRTTRPASSALYRLYWISCLQAASPMLFGLVHSAFQKR